MVTPVIVVHTSVRREPGVCEETCRCPKAACGCVASDRADDGCEWHGAAPVAPFMGWHRADECPASAVEAPDLGALVEVEVPARWVWPGDERVPVAVWRFRDAAKANDWVTVSVHYAKGTIIERRKGPEDSNGDWHYIEKLVTIESVVARMSRGDARLVLVYENGRAKAAWRRRTWASNWEDVGVKALRQWAVSAS